MTQQGERELNQELLDTLAEVLWQACSYDGELDSMGISVYADGMRLLARCGRVSIVSEAGRRVRARMVAEVEAPAWGDVCAGLSGAPPFVEKKWRYPVLSAEEASAQLVRVTGRLSQTGIEYGEPVTGLYLRSGRLCADQGMYEGRENGE